MADITSLTLEAGAVLVALCKSLHARVKHFRNAQALLADLEAFGLHVSHEQLFASVTLAQRLSQRVEAQHAHITSHYILKLQELLHETTTMLRRCKKSNGDIDRVFFAARGIDALQRQLASLREWQRNFESFQQLAIQLTATLDDEKHLPRSKFRVRRLGTNPLEEDLAQIEENSRIRFGRAEAAMGGLPETMNVLIESHPLSENAVDDADARECIALLSRHLSNVGSDGMLPCLGYRDSPSRDLVFKVPTSIAEPRSLRSVLSQFPQPDQTLRTNLGLQLAQAVLSVNRSNLVHKNINNLSVIAFTDKSTDSTQNPVSCLRLFLTDWVYMREVKAASSYCGTDDWGRNIFRHPQRQGLRPESRYHMRHDVYSLGVCLLEIGLWSPLLLSGHPSGRTVPGILILEVAQQRGLLKQSTSTTDGFKQLRKAAVSYDVLLELAGGKLQDAMGREFAALVRMCLLCPVEGLVDVRDIKADGTSFEKAFRKSILDPLKTLAESGESNQD